MIKSIIQNDQKNRRKERERLISKIRNTFQDYMIRPTIYKCVTKISIAFTASLLWERYIGKCGMRGMVEQAFFVAGFYFVVLSWMEYLKMDGVKVHFLLEERQKKKKPKRHSQADIADFADEKVISFEELEEDERIVCKFLSDIICFAVFMVPSIIVLIL